MEFANQRASDQRLRTLGSDDAQELTRLLRNTRISHVHIDWFSLAEWIQRRRVWGLQVGSRLRAFVAVSADSSPAAWIRGVAVAEALEPLPALRWLLDAAMPTLLADGADECAMMSIREWPNSLFPEMGFGIVAEVMTMACDVQDLIPARPTNGVIIRAVKPEDLRTLAAIETAAFAPIWRYSEPALTRALAQVVSFDVAMFDGQLVGYQCSTLSYQGAHLARMTVHPDWQGQGVGTALLVHALDGYRQRGVLRLSLNTQVDNHVSQRLYRRFGFRETGEVLPVWGRSLE